MSLTVKKATRQGIKPLIVLYAESGNGKSYSALLLARGMAGENGNVILGDSERGRGSLYADVLPGGYDVVDIDEPFTPAKFIEVIDLIEKSGATVGVLDGASPEWENGVLEMAAENESRTGKSGLHNWRIPKQEHQKFLSRLLRSPIPWVVTLRAKFKSRQIKENGKTVIIKDDVPSPIQAEEFIYESTCHAIILPDHSIRLTKCSHPALRSCFPEKGPITIEHGRMLAAWCAAPTGPGAPINVDEAFVNRSSPGYPNPATTSIASLKRELWAITESMHRGEKSSLQRFLLDEDLIRHTETVETLSAERLAQVLEKVKAWMKEHP